MHWLTNAVHITEVNVNGNSWSYAALALHACTEWTWSYASICITVTDRMRVWSSLISKVPHSSKIMWFFTLFQLFIMLSRSLSKRVSHSNIITKDSRFLRIHSFNFRKVSATVPLNMTLSLCYFLSSETLIIFRLKFFSCSCFMFCVLCLISVLYILSLDWITGLPIFFFNVDLHHGLAFKWVI